MLYCIEVQRECEEKCVMHHNFTMPPTRDDILEFVMEADLNYDDNYGKIDFYEVC